MPTQTLTLRQGPEGSPNFCFGLYSSTGDCVEFVQPDWDYPRLAGRLGWAVSQVKGPDPECEHEATDGTVWCPGCGLQAGDFLAAAFDWLAANADETFEVPDA